VSLSEVMRVSSAEAPTALPGPERRGEQFLAEIREQPDALTRLLEHEDEFARVAAAAARANESKIVRMVGHGSSDNAASYGVYAFGLLPRWTALRDSITLTVHYKTRLDLAGSIVIGVSQSGRTPDVVEYVQRARGSGAFTIALTNDPQSDLAHAAEATLPLGAGEEHAIAATKTYMNAVAALALFAAHVAGQGPQMSAGIREVVDQLRTLIPELEEQIPSIAAPFAFTGRMFVIGRGVVFGTAREIALKLLETCRVAAEPMTATGLAHGPVTALDPLFPVWAIASDDETLPATLEAARRVLGTGAVLIASGSAAAKVEGTQYLVPTPRPPLSLLSPLLSVVPGQLFAWALASAKGLDPDRPRGLSKVTLAT
jgi:glutamine---fructose-6-phosphate transaminase (isomerizing)